jgi:hypothetical protein
MSDFKGAILAASAKHPKPKERTFQYGTAGVRLICPLGNTSADLMRYIVSDESVPFPI